jgi:hypothetical protein
LKKKLKLLFPKPSPMVTNKQLPNDITQGGKQEDPVAFRPFTIVAQIIVRTDSDSFKIN